MTSLHRFPGTSEDWRVITHPNAWRTRCEDCQRVFRWFGRRKARCQCGTRYVKLWRAYMNRRMPTVSSGRPERKEEQ